MYDSRRSVWVCVSNMVCPLPQALEKNWRVIRDEALSVMDASTGLFLPEEENLREKGEWGQFTLWQQGTHTHAYVCMHSQPLLSV